MNPDASSSPEAFTYEMDDSETVSGAVLTAVSAVTGDSLGPSTPYEEEATPALDPLYTAIDPDALEALFRPTSAGGLSEGHVRFSYARCEVTVQSDGLISVRPTTDHQMGKYT